jgi:hypothetical protein
MNAPLPTSGNTAYAYAPWSALDSPGAFCCMSRSVAIALFSIVCCSPALLGVDAHDGTASTAATANKILFMDSSLLHRDDACRGPEVIRT